MFPAAQAESSLQSVRRAAAPERRGRRTRLPFVYRFFTEKSENWCWKLDQSWTEMRNSKLPYFDVLKGMGAHLK
jgi:hypothetical protein